MNSQIADTDHLNVKKIVGGGGELHAQVTAGNLYNLKAHAVGTPDIGITNTITGTNNIFPFMLPGGYPAPPLYDYNYSPVYTTASIPGTVPGAYRALHYTADYSNDGDYLVYSLLNQDAVNVGAYVDNQGTAGDPTDDTFNLSPTRVTIGAIKDAGLDNDYESIDLSSNTELIPNRQDDHTLAYYDGASNYGPHSYGDFHDGHQAQITAGMANVYAGSKLTIHPNSGEMGTTDFATANSHGINIIDNLNIVGRPVAPADCNECGYTPYDPTAWATVTIDRTTLHTLTDGITITHAPYLAPDNPKAGDALTLYKDYEANVVVGTNGILQGFGEITSVDNHSPLRPNVVGDVAVLAGGMIRPYDGNNGEREVYDYANKVPYVIPADGIFVVHGNALPGNQGYSPDFETNANKLKGLIMRVDGTTHFEHSSRLSTRLFAQVDSHDATITIVSDGTDTDVGQAGLPDPAHTPEFATANVSRYWGDSLESGSLVFDEIAYSSIYLQNGLNNPYTAAQLAGGTANGQAVPGQYYAQIGDAAVWAGVSQSNKVQYVPVFGFVNEIKSKLEYDIFKGRPGDQSGEHTYYYQVAYATGSQTIAALDGMPDANHLFNRDIVFSDMLGNWSFEKQDDGHGVVLRYRMLADHPQDGGIARDIPERNAVEAAKKLDESRYPFLTAYNIGDPTLDHSVFLPDPSIDGAGYQTAYDLGDVAAVQNSEIYAGNAYDEHGFNGDIKEYYWRENEIRPGVFNLPEVDGEYQNYWVEDIENYFRALQLEATSAATINRAVRLITAETYASQTNADLSLMAQFISGRERSAVSGLFQVENPVDAETRRAQDPFRHPLDEDLPAEYVPNPLRIWASGFGGAFSQRRRDDEYGYRTRHYGLQLGAVKEIGDLYLGLTGAYTRSHNRWSELQTRNKSDNFMGEALIGLRRGLGFLELHANAGWMDHRMGRDITLGESLNGDAYDPQLDCDITDNYYNGVYSTRQTGNYANRVLGGGLRLGYQKTFLDKWLFLPTIGVTFMDVRNPRGFTEDGPEKAAFRLVFGKGGISRTTLRVPLMLRLSRGISWNRGGPWILTPEARLGVTANLLDRGGKADYLWRGNPIRDRWMRAWGIEEDRFSWQAGGTLELSKRGRFFAALNYDYYFQKDSGNHSYSFQAGLNF